MSSIQFYALAIRLQKIPHFSLCCYNYGGAKAYRYIGFAIVNKKQCQVFIFEVVGITKINLNYVELSIIMPKLV